MHIVGFILARFPIRTILSLARMTTTRRTFISRRDAYRNAHEPLEDQVMFLVMLHRAAIENLFASTAAIRIGYP